MLFGAIGQAATMAILTGVNSQDAFGFQISGIVFLFVFNTFFAVGWLGMRYVMPAGDLTLTTTVAPKSGYLGTVWANNVG